MFTVQGDPLRVLNLAARDEPVGWDEAVLAVVARCESDGCGLVYELDDLRLSGERGWLGDCADCGGPLYVLNRHEADVGDADGEATRVAYTQGWVDGWDASAEAHAAFVAEHDACQRCRRVFADAVEASR